MLLEQIEQNDWNKILPLFPLHITKSGECQKIARARMHARTHAHTNVVITVLMMMILILTILQDSSLNSVSRKEKKNFPLIFSRVEIWWSEIWYVGCSYNNFFMMITMMMTILLLLRFPININNDEMKWNASHHRLLVMQHLSSEQRNKQTNCNYEKLTKNYVK